MNYQSLTSQGEEGNNWGIIRIFPFSKPAEGKGKKGRTPLGGSLIPLLGSRRVF